VVEMGVAKFGGIATTCVAVLDEESSEKLPSKTPTRHDENARMIERAWFGSGAEIRQDTPYISRSAMMDMLVSDGNTERTAKNKLEPSRPNGIICPSLNSGFIESFENGWRVINPTIASAMMVKRNAK